MTAPTLTAYKVTIGTTATSCSIGSTAVDGKYPITLEVPFGTDVSELVTTWTSGTAGATLTAGSTTVTSGTTKVNYSSPVTVTLTKDNESTVYLVTITIDEASVMSVENINMAGWFKVKVVKLKDFDYESGGFKTPYKSKAVLAVNGPGGLTGYVYTDTSGSAPVQKVKLFAGTSEASGELTADVYLLLE